MRWSEPHFCRQYSSASFVGRESLNTTPQLHVDGYETPVKFFSTRRYLKGPVIAVNRFFPGRVLFMVSADLSQCAQQPPLDSVCHANRPGILLFAQKWTAIKCGGFLDKFFDVRPHVSVFLSLQGSCFSAGQQPFDGPDIDPAEPIIKAQLAFLPPNRLVSPKQPPQPV
jgi:hypothetical protein